MAEMNTQEFRELYGKAVRERCSGGPFHKGPTVMRAYCGECIVGLCAAAWEAGKAAGLSEAGGGENAAPTGAQKPGEMRAVTLDGKTVSVGYRVVSVPPRRPVAIGQKIAEGLKGEE